jgi:ABC-type multidrug transport system fused ATPase/permease subunit
MRFSPTSSLLRFIRPYWWILPILVVLGITASLAEGLGIGLIIPIIDLLLGVEQTEPTGPFASAMQHFASVLGDQKIYLVLAILLLVMLKTFFLCLEAIVATNINGRITRDLRVAICRQLLEVGMAFHCRSTQGHLMNTQDFQTHRTSEALTALSVLISSACTVLVFSLILFLLSWKLTLIALISAVPATLLVRALSNRAHTNGDRFVRQHSALVSRMLEVLNGMRTIRLFNQEEAEAYRFAVIADKVRHSFVRAETLVQIMPALVELIYVPIFIAVVFYALSTEIGFSVLMVFLLLLYRLQNPLKKLDASRVTLSTYASGIAEVDKLLDRSDKPYLTSGRRQMDGVNADIYFANVSFRYHPHEFPALQNVSLRISRNTVYAIVGESGAGKSTLINLLCRFYDPSNGKILINGIDLKDLNLHSWRQRIAFSGQDAELMAGTIASNIAYGRPDAGMEAIRKAARLANVADFIETLSEGYKTELGMRGMRLSGGQRQRIALARALLCKPDILILDEATNAVDTVTEQAIHEAIEGLAGTMTILIIAHRMAALRCAEKVIVLDKGRIIEQGTPAELARADSILTHHYRAAGSEC